MEFFFFDRLGLCTGESKFMDSKQYVEDKSFYHSTSLLSNGKKTICLSIAITRSKAHLLKKIYFFQPIDYKAAMEP